MKKTILALLLLATSLCAEGQDLKDMIARDTLVYFFPLDQSQLAHFVDPDVSRDSNIFIQHKPYTYHYLDSTIDSKLPQGSYYKVEIKGQNVYKNLYLHSTLDLQHSEETDRVVFYPIDTRDHRLQTGLTLLIESDTLHYDIGMGGYVYDYADKKDLNQAKTLYCLLDSGVIIQHLAIYSTKSAKNRSERSDESIAPGYLITDKTMYRKGDTLRSSAYFIHPKKGKPLKKKIRCRVVNNGEVFLDTLVKTKKGFIETQWQIPDSLQLDQTYQLQYHYTKNNKSYTRQKSFEVKDYELKEEIYNISMAKTKYIAGQDLLYQVTATDANGFAQTYGSVDFRLYLDDIKALDTALYALLRDTPLLHTQHELSPEGIEEYKIDTSIMVPGIADYRAVFILRDEKNKEHKFEHKFSYDSRPERYTVMQTADSILIDYLLLSKSTPQQITLISINEEGDSTTTENAQLPLRRADYHGLKRVIAVADHKIVVDYTLIRSTYNSIDIEADQTKDSLYIHLKSRITAPVHYVIYKNNTVYKKGLSNELSFHERCTPKDLYSIRMVHNIEGSMHTQVQKYEVRPQNKRLNIKAKFPTEASPGDQVQIDFVVTDFYDAPVASAALSSYGVKTSFGDSSIVTAAYNPKSRSSTLMSIPEKDPRHWTPQPLQFSASARLTNWDLSKYRIYSNEYYQFLYPPQELFTKDVPTDDSLCQFSVQVIGPDKVYSPAYVLVDDHPVFYAQSSDLNTSIIPPGMHRIKCRISDKLLDLGSHNFMSHTKKILSFSLDSIGNQKKIIILKDSLNSFYLDSTETNAIIEHSLLTSPLKLDSLVLCTGNRCTRNLLSKRYRSIQIGGHQAMMWGPFYTRNTMSQVFLNDKLKNFDLRDREILYFDDSLKVSQRIYIAPSTLLPCQIKSIPVNTALDTLYYPKPDKKVKVETQSTAQINTAAKPRPKAQINQNYALPIRDSQSTQIHLLNYQQNGTNGLWIVKKSNIKESRYLAGPKDRASIARGGIVDVVIPLKNDQVIAIQNLNIDSLSDIYICLDSIRSDTLSAAELIFYQNIYSTLTSKNQKLFINYPDEVKVAIKKNGSSRNNILLKGRLVHSRSQFQNIYLEKNGVFKAGALTDEFGNFNFLDLESGTYQLKIFPAQTNPLYVYNIHLAAGGEYFITIQSVNENSNLTLINSSYNNLQIEIKKESRNSWIKIYDKDTREKLYGANMTLKLNGNVIKSNRLKGNFIPIQNQLYQDSSQLEIILEHPLYKKLIVQNLTNSAMLSYQIKVFMDKTTEIDTLTQVINTNTLSSLLPLNVIDPEQDYTPRPSQTKQDERLIPTANLGGNSEIYGVISDVEGPLPGARVTFYQDGIIKYQVKTDQNGVYRIKTLSLGQYELEASFVGVGKAKKKVNIAINESQRIDILIKQSVKELQSLSEVAVTAAPILEDQPSREVVGTSMTTTRGTRNSNDFANLSGSKLEQKEKYLSLDDGRDESTVYIVDGVILRGNRIKNSADLPPKESSQDAYSDWISTISSSDIRSRFSDVAFWEPGLITDRAGVCKINFKLPDDITHWDINTVSFGSDFRSGYAIHTLKSYKPLYTKGLIPRFLYPQDSLMCYAKYVNLTDTPRHIQWQIEAAPAPNIKGDSLLSDYLTDSIWLSPSPAQDTLHWVSSLNTANNRGDVEKRNIPIMSSALSVSDFDAYTLEDTSITITNTGDSMSLLVTNNLQEILQKEIENLRAYDYHCNEQLSSKLIAEVIAYRLAQHKKSKVSRSEIRKLCTKLSRSQNPDGSWSWWQGKGDVHITGIVLQALYEARKAGAQIWNYRDAIYYMLRQVQTQNGTLQLYTLSLLAAIDELPKEYKKYWEEINPDKIYTEQDVLRYEYLREFYTSKTNKNRVIAAMQNTIANRYIPYAGEFYHNPMAVTLSSLYLYSKSSLASQLYGSLDQMIDNQFLKNINNTYLRSLFLLSYYEHVKSLKPSRSTLTIGGTTTSDFPYKKQLTQGTHTLNYAGSRGYAYVSKTQNYSEPQTKNTYFGIETRITDLQGSPTEMTKGNRYIYQVKIFAKEDYDYVVTSIPLPAACPLAYEIDPPAGVEHIEFYRNKVVLYYRKMPVGEHTIRLPLQASWTGKSYMPAVQVSDMYMPFKNGNNTNTTLLIK